MPGGPLNHHPEDVSCEREERDPAHDEGQGSPGLLAREIDDRMHDPSGDEDAEDDLGEAR